METEERNNRDEESGRGTSQLGGSSNTNKECGPATTRRHLRREDGRVPIKDLVVESPSAPSASLPCSSCCDACWSSKKKWHPTHAVLTDPATGSKFSWNARSHRKLRFPASLEVDPLRRQGHHPPTAHQRWHLLSWEPRIVTWHICWVGVVANTLWVVNGLYATWPGVAQAADPLLISYGTGVLGAFLFIVAGYLGFVEAINQTFSHVDLPRLSRHRNKSFRNGKLDRFRSPSSKLVYGQWPSPIGHDLLDLSASSQSNRSKRARFLQLGYPLVLDAQSQRLLTAPHMESLLSTTTPDEQLVGRKIVILIGGHVLSATIDECHCKHAAPKELVDDGDDGVSKTMEEGYRWWTWSPDLSYLGIFNAVVFFASTVIFFIPACVWWPMSESRASLGQTIFWVYVLQIIPCLGFIYFGLATMAEASGSWMQPAPDSIGWWISFLNFLGGVGFFLYAVLALPGWVHPDCCGALTQYGANLATFWGSCFFWVSGILQCVEFSSQHPILL